MYQKTIMAIVPWALCISVLAAGEMEIRSVTAPEGPEGLCETALQFTEPGAYADVMRKIVYAEQLRQRRSRMH